MLIALEVPSIDAETRGIFERRLYREKYFHDDARGQIIFLIRCITESTGNEGALVGPVVRAVSSAVKTEWMARGLDLIAAFDSIPLLSTLTTLRDLFGDNAEPHLETVIRRKLRAILEPANAKPRKVKCEPKPPRSVTRIAGVEANVKLGAELLALRATAKSNRAFGRAMRAKFDVDAQLASEAMKVARLYAGRDEIVTRLSWDCLVRLSSKTVPAHARQAIEARVIAGEKIVASDIVRARGALKPGRPRRPCKETSAPMPVGRPVSATVARRMAA